MLRPENTLNVCELTTKIKIATNAIIYAVSKVIKFILTNENHIIILSLDLKSIQIRFYVDTSLNNLIYEGSLYNYILSICDKEKTLGPIASSSTQLKRVTQFN